MDEFARLTSTRNWVKDSKRWIKERKAFLRAEYEGYTKCYGYDNGCKLSVWQDLCDELGMEVIPGSITKCKAVSISRMTISSPASDV